MKSVCVTTQTIHWMCRLRTHQLPGSLRPQPAIGNTYRPATAAPNLKPTRIVHLLARPPVTQPVQPSRTPPRNRNGTRSDQRRTPRPQHRRLTRPTRPGTAPPAAGSSSTSSPTSSRTQGGRLPGRSTRVQRCRRRPSSPAAGSRPKPKTSTHKENVPSSRRSTRLKGMTAKPTTHTTRHLVTVGAIWGQVIASSLVGVHETLVDAENKNRLSGGAAGRVAPGQRVEWSAPQR